MVLLLAGCGQASITSGAPHTSGQSDVVDVAVDFFQDDDLIDPFFEGVATTYDGPVALAQDIMVFNVTPEQIVLRMAKTEQLWWAPQDPEAKGGDTLEEGYVSPARTPDWVVATKIETNE